MRQKLNAPSSSRTLAYLLGMLAAVSVADTASAQTELLSIEFNEDDQPGFDLWPIPIGGSLMGAQFGAITVDVSTNTSFAQPTNRGSTNGVPPGYTYQHLYEDLLHAFTPTGTCTLDFGGLRPNDQYRFVLYAWDPGTSSGTHEWTVTQGTSIPPMITVDWATPLTSNDTFALVFEVTTDANGAFQVDNTAGLAGSAINGFKLFEYGTLGSAYCSPAVPNSSGVPALITASGSDVVADNDVTLEAASLPANQFGFFLNSLSQGFVPGPAGSQGNLCLSGAIGRYNPATGYPVQNSGAAGSISIVLDLPNTPTPTGFTSVTAGQTWNFQAWYRDLNPGPTSNFTDAVSITFL